MSAEASFLLVSGLVSLATAGYRCYGRSKKNKIYKKKISALIMSQGCGRTQLKENLESQSADLVIIDMSAVVNSEDELEYMKKSKEYLKDLLKNFPKKRFLLLLQSIQESRNLDIPDSSAFVVCPSIKLFNDILGDINPVEQIRKNNIEKKRLMLIENATNLNIFKSFNELYQIIKQEYNLKGTF